MDRILDLSSLDFEGTTFRPDRHNNNAEVNSNTIPLATENVNEENAALQPDRFADNDEVNSSTIPLGTVDVNNENTEVRAPIAVSPMLQQYRIDEDFNDFSSYAVMREGGLLLSGTENSHTAAILAAISKVFSQK